MRKKRDAYVYQLKDGNKIVYYGSTNDRSQRFGEHQRSAKEFTTMEKLHGPMCRENAGKLETDYIRRYTIQYGGRPPKYNKQKTT